MEATGLVLSIGALLLTCCQLIERYNAYQEYENAASIASTRYRVSQAKLEKWQSEVGFVNGKKTKQSCPFLENSDDAAQIEDLLKAIKSCFGEISAHLPKSHKRIPKLVCAKLKWMGKDKDIVGRHVDVVEALVDSLCERFPSKDLCQMVHKLHGDITVLVGQKILDTEIRNTQRIEEWLAVRHFVQDYADFSNQRATGTCEWISDNSAYQQWMDDLNSCSEEAKVFWICGPLGYGKSVLFGSILAKLTVDKDIPIAYCFARLHLATSGRLSDVPRLLVAQLLKQKPQAKVLAMDAMESSKNHRATKEESWELLREVCSNTAPCMIAVDGLDEYNLPEDDRESFVTECVSRLAGINIRILISSRPESDINDQFNEIVNDHGRLSVHHCHLTPKLTQPDIRKCVEEMVSRRLAKSKPELQAKIINEMIKRSEGMFLWVRLQEADLTHTKSKHELLKLVRSMPIGLEPTYNLYWTRIQSLRDDARDKAIALLTWITYATRPLKITEIAEALCMSSFILEQSCNFSDHSDDSDDSDDDAAEALCPGRLPEVIDDSYVNEVIRGLGGSIVETRPGEDESVASQTVHFLHTSARDFIVRKLSESMHQTGDSLINGQGSLAKCCIQYLRCDAAWERPIEQWDSNTWMSKPALLAYAVESWPKHARQAMKDESSTMSFVVEFMIEDSLNFSKWIRCFENKRVLQYSESVRKGLISGTPLYYACLLSLHAVIKMIFEKDKDALNKVGGEYGTPLQAACANCDLELIKQLYGWGASLEVSGGIFGNALNAAASLGYEKGVSFLIDSAKSARMLSTENCGKSPGENNIGAPEPPSPIDRCVPTLFMREAIHFFHEERYRNFSPLHCSAWHEHHKIAELLLKAGANVNVKDNIDCTPLILASEKGNLELVTLFLDFGADIEATTDSENDALTALNAASRYGQLPIVEKLVMAGADLVTPNTRTWRPLDYAAYRNRGEVVQLLLLHDAPINAEEDGSDQALWHTSYGNAPEAAKLLIKHGARGYGKDSVSPKSVIHTAASQGIVEMTKLFLEMRMPVDLCTSDGGRQPIHGAAINGEVDTIRLLHEHGALLDARTATGDTSLMFAIHSDNYDTVKYLLHYGADVNATSNTQAAPIHIAYNLGHFEILQLLLDYHADIDLLKSSDTPLSTLSSLSADAKFISSIAADLHEVLASGNVSLLPEFNAPQLLLCWFVNKLPKSQPSPHMVSVFRHLRKQGANINQADTFGDTYLHYVCDGLVSKYNMQLLLDNGADPNIRSQQGSRPFDLLAAKGIGELAQAEYLLTHMHKYESSGATICGRLSPPFDPGIIMPGTWQATYVYSTLGKEVITDLEIYPMTKHELELIPHTSTFFAASAKDCDGAFQMLGNAARGEDNFWFNMIYESYGVLCFGTLIVVLADDKDIIDDENRKNRTNVWPRKLIIEGKWGTSYTRLYGTFKLVRNIVEEEEIANYVALILVTEP